MSGNEREEGRQLLEEHGRDARRAGLNVGAAIAAAREKPKKEYKMTQQQKTRRPGSFLGIDLSVDLPEVDEMHVEIEEVVRDFTTFSQVVVPRTDKALAIMRDYRSLPVNDPKRAAEEGYFQKAVALLKSFLGVENGEMVTLARKTYAVALAKFVVTTRDGLQDLVHTDAKRGYRKLGLPNLTNLSLDGGTPILSETFHGLAEEKAKEEMGRLRKEAKRGDEPNFVRIDRVWYKVGGLSKVESRSLVDYIVAARRETGVKEGDRRTKADEEFQKGANTNLAELREENPSGDYVIDVPGERVEFKDGSTRFHSGGLVKVVVADGEVSVVEASKANVGFSNHIEGFGPQQNKVDEVVTIPTESLWKDEYKADGRKWLADRKQKLHGILRRGMRKYEEEARKTKEAKESNGSKSVAEPETVEDRERDLKGWVEGLKSSEASSENGSSDEQHAAQESEQSGAEAAEDSASAK